MGARFRIAVGAKQEVGEVDMPDRILRDGEDRLRIDAAGGVDGAHIRQQRCEFVERAEICRHSPQHIDEGLLGLLAPVERAEQHRALDFSIDGVALAGVTREQFVQLSQSGFLREPGRPASVGVRW